MSACLSLRRSLVRLKVDLIVVSGGDRRRLAAKKATNDHPYRDEPSCPDPVGAGMVASLARPGGNVTGTLEFSARARQQKAGDTQGR